MHAQAVDIRPISERKWVWVEALVIHNDTAIPFEVNRPYDSLERYTCIRSFH